METADGTNQSGYEYQLGDHTYIQKPLVLGQLEQIAKSLLGLPLNLFNMEAMKKDTQGEALKGTLIKLFEEGLLVEAMSAALIPKGQGVRNRDLKTIQDDIRYECDLSVGVKIITDFFECNAPSNLVSIWKGSMIGGMMTAKTPTLETPLPDGQTSSSPSVMETP
jgi:hypothetical protein